MDTQTVKHILFSWMLEKTQERIQTWWVFAMKSWQDCVKSAIYGLTNSANQLQGLSGYKDIQDDIIIIRNKLRKKLDGE